MKKGIKFNKRWVWMDKWFVTRSAQTIWKAVTQKLPRASEKKSFKKGMKKKEIEISINEHATHGNTNFMIA